MRPDLIKTFKTKMKDFQARIAPHKKRFSPVFPIILTHNTGTVFYAPSKSAGPPKARWLELDGSLGHLKLSRMAYETHMVNTDTFALNRFSDVHFVIKNGKIMCPSKFGNSPVRGMFVEQYGSIDQRPQNVWIFAVINGILEFKLVYSA
jgi:hypothetical protein